MKSMKNPAENIFFGAQVRHHGTIAQESGIIAFWLLDLRGGLSSEKRRPKGN